MTAASTTVELLRAATERLLQGSPLHTDGRLTDTNLWVEAGQRPENRSMLYRAEFADVVAAWKAQKQLRTAGMNARAPVTAQQLEALQLRLDTKTTLARQYKEQRDRYKAALDAAASRLMGLEEQNRLLRELLQAADGVTSLERRQD